MTRKNTFKYLKKIICMVLIVALLINTMPAELFAQKYTPQYQSSMPPISEESITMIHGAPAPVIPTIVEQKKEYTSVIENEIRNSGKEEGEEAVLEMRRLRGEFGKVFGGGRYGHETFHKLYERTYHEVFEEYSILQRVSNNKKSKDEDLKKSLEYLYNAEVCINIWKGSVRKEEEIVCGTYAYMAEALVGGWMSTERGGYGILKESYYLSELIWLGLVSKADRKRIRGLLWEKMEGEDHFIDEYIDSCNVKEEDYRKKDSCELGLDGIELLVASSTSESELNEVADYINEKVLKRSIKGRPYSAMLLLPGITGLVAIDTARSYDLVKKFLTDYSIPNKAGATLDTYNGILSLTGISQMGQDIAILFNSGELSPTRYLNKYSKRWQYIDKEESKELGVRDYYLENEAWAFDRSDIAMENYYNMAYGNLLTDVGIFLSEQSGRWSKLSDEILNGYMKGKTTHLPLLVGILKNRYNGFVKDGLEKSFYVDMNYGTAQMIHYKYGTGISGKNVYSLEYYKGRQMANSITEMLDIFVDVAMIGMLIVSLPSIMSRFYRIGRLVRYGKFRTLIKVPRSMKNASTVAKGANVKVEPKASSKAQPKAQTKVTPKAQPKASPKAQPKVEPKVEPKAQANSGTGASAGASTNAGAAESAMGKVRGKAKPIYNEPKKATKDKFFKPINKKIENMTFKEKIQNRGFMVKMKAEGVGEVTRDLFRGLRKSPGVTVNIVGAVSAEGAPMVQASAKAAVEVVTTVPAESGVLLETTKVGAFGNSASAPLRFSEMGRVGTTATKMPVAPKLPSTRIAPLSNFGRMGAFSTFGNTFANNNSLLFGKGSGVITQDIGPMSIKDVPLQVYDIKTTRIRDGKPVTAPKGDPLGYRILSTFYNKVWKPSKREFKATVKEIKGIPFVNNIINTYGVPKDAPKLVQMQREKELRPIKAAVAAAVIATGFTLLSPTLFVGAPVAIGSTLAAVAPIASSNLNPQIDPENTGNVFSGIKNTIQNAKYKHYVLKNNLRRVAYIKKNMPTLTFAEVNLDDEGKNTVQVENDLGFVAQSEYENYYVNNIEDADQAKARFDRKVTHDNMLAELIFETLSSPTEKQLIWIMASAADDAFKILAAQLMKELGYAGISDIEIASYFTSIFNTVKINLPKLTEEDIARLQALTRRNVEKAENLLDVASPEDPILTGAIVDLDILKKEMSDRATDALYNDSDLTKDILEPLIQTQRNDFSTTYKNILPIYLQYNDGTLSKKPKIYIVLSEEITVPDGFVVAQDESTAYKFVVSDILAINKSNSSSHSPFKNPKKMYNLSAKDKQLLIETSLSSEDKSYIAASVQKADLTTTDQDDLFALVKALPKDRLDWALTAISLVAGADLAASLSSQFKKLIPIYGAMLAVAGFGYFSPKIANWFKNKINKWGNVKTAEIGLYAMLAASAVGITAGMWGNYNPATAGIYGITASVIFFTVAATVASIFNTIKGPMLKNVYTDDTIFSSKNMNFDTVKALAKVLVAGIPAIFAIPEIITSMMNQGAEEAAIGWISHLPNINWSVMVPFTALTSLWGLYSIYHSRLKTEIKKEDPAKSTTQEDSSISAEDKAKAEAAKKAEDDNFKKEVANKFNDIIKPLIKPEYRRLFMIYLPYGIVQSIIIGQIAGITLNKAALFVTLTGSLVSWLVRKGSTKLIKEGKINEDQLTGFMLPLMAASYIGLFLSPFDLSMTSESIPLLLSILGAYISTPALGTVENTRMLNKTVDYYDKERAKIEDDSNLTPEEKKAAIDKLNKEMAAMKTQTSTHYNNGNASALYPIIGMALAAMMLLDFFPNSAISQALPDIADALGGVTNAVDPKDLLKLSFFKVFLSLAAGLASATFISNMSLTKSIFSSNKVKISQEMIDANKVTAEALKLDVNDMQSNIIELNKEIEALNTDLTLNRIRQSSEETANKWLQKAISINNRLKFLSEHDADAATKLAGAIETFKNSVMPNLKYIVEEVSPANNHYLSDEKISDYSLQFLFQYNELMASVNASQFNYIEEGIKTPIKETHFTKALTYRDGLISLLKKKQSGGAYNAMFKDAQDLYDKALSEITLYEKDNNLTEWQDERIIVLKKQLNNIRREFLQNN